MVENEITQYQELEKYLRFHEALLTIQVQNMQHLVAVLPFKKLNKINVDAAIKNGSPIISPAQIIVEEKELELMFDQIVPLLKQFGDFADDLKKLDDLNDKRKFSLKMLVNQIFERDTNKWLKLSQDLQISSKVLHDIGEYLSKPYLELCSEFFTKKLKNINWERAFCPICGYHPAMAIVHEELNSRLFWCRLCGTEWNYSHSNCPYCANDNPKTLKHIFPPEKSPYRIDGCDECKTFLKVVNHHFIQTSPNFEVDYLKTFHLNLLAIENGYREMNEFICL